MEVFEWSSGRSSPAENNYAALGTFDGVHIGHRSVIRRAQAAAAANSGCSVVVTFDPHPREITNQLSGPALLTGFADKVRLLEAMGIDILAKIPFTPSVAQLSPEEFVRDVLRRDLKLCYICIGFNYRFGRGGNGDTEMLRELGKKYGIAVDVLAPVTCGGITVSSTAIRRLLEAGRVEEAADCLGGYPFLSGKVVAGDRRGRSLGFPTANIDVDPRLVQPAAGVYAVYVCLSGRRFRGIANIGYSPTFYAAEKRRLRLEVHILDFVQDIYGADLTVEFVTRIRPERTFRDGNELAEQLKLDRAVAERVLNEPEIKHYRKSELINGIGNR